MPPRLIILSCFSFQESMESDLTKEKWTPRLRWMAAQFIQMKDPLFTDAHYGFDWPGHLVNKRQFKRTTVEALLVFGKGLKLLKHKVRNGDVNH